MCTTAGSAGLTVVQVSSFVGLGYVMEARAFHPPSSRSRLRATAPGGLGIVSGGDGLEAGPTSAKRQVTFAPL
jgi:hypothetical protein